MEDFEIEFTAKVPSFEGFSFWPYLDTHNPPIVTISIGCALTLADALTLPFTINGKAASQSEILIGFKKVQGMRPGMLSKFYHYPGCLVLSTASCQELFGKRVPGFTKQLEGLFPTFASFPTGVKVVLLDMIFTLGLGGLEEYHHFIASIKSGDWQEASTQCIRDANVRAYNDRNKWAEQTILQSA